VNDLKTRPLVTHNLLKAYGQQDVKESQQGGFAELLKGSINKTNEMQKTASSAVESAIIGQEQDLHRVMIAQEEASITFDLLMEVRNKLLEAYQQVMSMQL
jgi:flagellar hook-basal body complex protein FliE